MVSSVGACGAAQQKATKLPYEGPLVPTPGGSPEAWPTRTPDETASQDPAYSDAGSSPDERWRFGIGIAEAADVAYWAGKLGAAWYLDWGAREVETPGGLEYWRMVRTGPRGLSPPVEKLAALARAYPGSIWILGNEPDVIWQDNLPPEEFARQFARAYAVIMDADPTARIAVGAVAQVSPLRIEYLDRVLAAYRSEYRQELPADIWTVHTYILPERAGDWGVGIPPGMDAEAGQIYEIQDHDRLDLLEAQIRSFRSWMAENGYQDCPLALTELGILMHPAYGFTEQRVQRYMRSAFDMLLSLEDEQIGPARDGHRLVQQWAWFSLSYSLYPASDLADLERGELTPVGRAYRSYVSGMPGSEDEHGESRPD